MESSKTSLFILVLSSILLLGATSEPNVQNSKLSIVQEPKCAEVKRHCSNLIDESDDILIVECLQSIDPRTLSGLNEQCQHIIWAHMRDAIKDENVKDFLLPVCKMELQKVNCQLGQSENYLKCLVSHKEVIEDNDCLHALLRLENAAFYDYRWISNFLTTCNDDIEKLQCGRIDHDGLTQAETIVCLQNHFMDVNENCRKEIFKLSEIQSDSIKLDRQLYMACAQDHMRYCRQFAPGSGRVFNCLLAHRQDTLTSQCQNHMFRRLKLQSQDYRINKGLMRACKEDIKRSHCRRQTSDDKSIRLAQVLLCLENVVKNGTKIDPNCAAEMSDQRKILLEDYRLSPEIVDKCAPDIKKFCTGLETGGKTIHCLMEHARNPLAAGNTRIRTMCQRALEDLVKQTDAGEDWRVDPVLHEACSPVVKVLCQGVRGGEGRVMSCLMDGIGSDLMTEECEEPLLQIQFFLARDFKLDPQLYRACKDDAATFCHANSEWDENGENFNPEIGPLILPCLYRTAYNGGKELQLSQQCFDQVKRVMRQRAISVDLQPQIEEACLIDLGLHCPKTNKGEEILCLQNSLEKLDKKCQEVVEQYTEQESQTVELNPYISSNCKGIIQDLCRSEYKRDDGSVMECLIAHKNDPAVRKRPKCRISIEHFQLISLKSYRFSYKFKTACRTYVARFCLTAQTKAAAIACLSEKITNDTIAGVKSDIQKDCRQQVKAQLFQQRENIHFDQKLENACRHEIKEHCGEVEAGSANVLECLQSTPEKKLGEQCKIELFKVKKQEVMDNSVDYALITSCAESIRSYCPKIEHSRVLECLKRHKDEHGFDQHCLLIVKHRIIEQNTDYRLNPALQDNCKLDIKAFCRDVAVQAKPEKELNGEVINCLKVHFKNNKLSSRCEKEMTSILRDQALDIQLNPLLRAVCKYELRTLCMDELERDSMDAEECLKDKLLKKQIPSPACQVEVANLIQESQADIQVDPLLQQTCSVDLIKYCGDVPQGNGRHVLCLKQVLQDKAKQLTIDCKNMLTKRLEMYRNVAEKQPLANMHQLYSQVVDSPAKHYFFFVLLMMTGTMFLMGIFCGRVSRRHMLIKQK